MILGIAFIVLISLSLFVPLPINLSDALAVHVKNLSKEILGYVEPLNVFNDTISMLLRRAATEGDLNTLLKVFYLDRDKDGVPDLAEILGGTSPYLLNSFGYSDVATYVGRIAIDGFDIDWSVNSLCVYEASFKVSEGMVFLPIEKALATADDKYLYVCLKLRDFVYGNSTAIKYIVYIDTGDAIVEPDRIARWGTCIEARFRLVDILGFEEVDLVARVSVQSIEAGYAVVHLDLAKIPKLSGRCWHRPVDPIWLRMRLPEEGLPFYPIAIFGDNRPTRWWEEVEFNEETYEMLKEIRLLNPVATIGVGDHTGAGMYRQIREFVRATAGISNLWIVAGNHDWSYTKYANRSAWYRYTVPDLYTRDLGPWRFVFINGYTLNQSLYPELLGILDKSCGENRYLVLVWHVPITYNSYDYPTDFSFEQMKMLRDAVHRYRSCIKLMLFGHLHVFKDGIYEGIKYIVTGGGGAPLSSPSQGIPVYHYVVALLYPNGSYRYVPVSVKEGALHIDVVIDRGTIKYIIENSKRSIYGDLISIPIKIERYIKGIHIEVFALIPPGRSEIVFEVTDGGIRMYASGVDTWFAYIWSLGVVKPRNGVVYIELGKTEPRIVDIVYRGSQLCVSIENGIYASLTIRFDGYSHSYDMAKQESTYCFDLSILLEVRKNLRLEPRIEILTSNGYVMYGEFIVDVEAPRIDLKNFHPYTRDRLVFVVELYDESKYILYIVVDDELVFERLYSAGKHDERISIDMTRYGMGMHTLAIIAEDIHGNRREVSRWVILDAYPPRIEVPRTVYVPTPEAYVKIVVSDEDNFDVELKCLNTSLYKVFSNLRHKASIVFRPISFGIASNGRYMFEVIAMDTANNSVEKRFLLIVGSELATASSTTMGIPSSTIERTAIVSTTTRPRPTAIQALPPIAIGIASVSAITIILLGLYLYTRKYR